MGTRGRVVIPAEMRSALSIDEGTQLVALVEDDAVLLLPRPAVKRRLRKLFAGIEARLSAELINERRTAASRGE
jgi:AbrB family looped-hinge helix DNA binding protein